MTSVRKAKTDSVDTITPFDAGCQSFIDGLSVPDGLRHYGVDSKNRDATESFLQGYQIESTDIEVVLDQYNQIDRTTGL